MLREWANDKRLGRHGIAFKSGVGTVDEYGRPGRGQVKRRTKCDGTIDAFGRSVHPRSLCPVKRHFLPVQSKKVLPKKLAHMLEQISKPADNGKIPTHRVFRLCDVNDEQYNDRQQESPDDKYENRRECLNEGKRVIHHDENFFARM